jgi:hypothetical protein
MLRTYAEITADPDFKQAVQILVDTNISAVGQIEDDIKVKRVEDQISKEMKELMTGVERRSCKCTKDQDTVGKGTPAEHKRCGGKRTG